MWNILCTTAVVYVLYILFGGCIFLFLESIHQLEIEEMEHNASVNFAEIHSKLISDDFTDEEISKVVELWEKTMFLPYFDNKTITHEEVWTFSNSFSFAFHLCSTIGYGHISPVTHEGQLLVIVYAVIGIPLHIIFYKSFGDAFARNYQEIMFLIGGASDSKTRKFLATVVYYSAWTLVFFVLPSCVFMHTEDWTFVEGVYYCFITLTTVGLGDYVAGNRVAGGWYSYVYRVFIFMWMVYGLAFATMIVDILTHMYQINLLFALRVKPKKCEVNLYRVYVDIEKLDIHFRLLKSEGVKHKFSLWGVRKDTQRAVDFQMVHLSNLTVLTDKTQGETMRLLDEMNDTKIVDAFPLKSTD